MCLLRTRTTTTTTTPPPPLQECFHSSASEWCAQVCARSSARTPSSHLSANVGCRHLFRREHRCWPPTEARARAGNASALNDCVRADAQLEYRSLARLSSSRGGRRRNQRAALVRAARLKPKVGARLAVHQTSKFAIRNQPIGAIYFAPFLLCGFISFI